MNTIEHPDTEEPLADNVPRCSLKLQQPIHDKPLVIKEPDEVKKVDLDSLQLSVCSGLNQDLFSVYKQPPKLRKKLLSKAVDKIVLENFADLPYDEEYSETIIDLAIK